LLLGLSLWFLILADESKRNHKSFPTVSNRSENPLPGVFAKYHGKREGDPVKKECEEQKKEQPRCHAKLCGGGDSLKALGIVAGYLAERSFNLSNDNVF